MSLGAAVPGCWHCGAESPRSESSQAQHFNSVGKALVFGSEVLSESWESSGLWGYCRPASHTWVMSSQARLLVTWALNPLLSAPLWTQGRSFPAPHLHGWMRVWLSQALGRTQVQGEGNVGRVNAQTDGCEWCWGMGSS